MTSAKKQASKLPHNQIILKSLASFGAGDFCLNIP